MAEQDSNQNQYRRLTHDDLERIAGERLPERVSSSLLKAHVAIPTNLAWTADDPEGEDSPSYDRDLRIDRSG